MIVTRRASMGPVTGTTEEVAVDFPITPPNSPVTVSFPVESPLKPGSAVFISLTQAFPGNFLVYAEGAVTTLGQVTASFFNVIGNVGIVSINLHVRIEAHNTEQLA